VASSTGKRQRPNRNHRPCDSWRSGGFITFRYKLNLTLWVDLKGERDHRAGNDEYLRRRLVY